MRAGSFITHMQSLLGDPEGDFHTTEKMLLHLNTAIEDICTRSRTICSWHYISAEEDRGMYGLPENFLEFKFVGFYYRDQLIPLSPSGITGAAPSVFSERFTNYNQIPLTYADGGNASTEKLVGTVIETEDSVVAYYAGVEVPEDAADTTSMGTATANQYTWSDVSDADIRHGRWRGEVADAVARDAVTDNLANDVLFQLDNNTFWEWEVGSGWNDITGYIATFFIDHVGTDSFSSMFLSEGYTDAQLDTYFETNTFSTIKSTYVHRTGDVNQLQRLTAITPRLENEYTWVDISDSDIRFNGRWRGEVADTTARNALTGNENGDVAFKLDDNTLWEWNELSSSWDNVTSKPGYLLIDHIPPESGDTVVFLNQGYTDAELDTYFETHELSTSHSTYVHRTGDINQLQRLTAITEVEATTENVLGDYVIDYVHDNGPIVGYIDSYGDPIPTNETGLVFIEGNQAFQIVENGVGQADCTNISDLQTENGNLTLSFIGRSEESDLSSFWTEDEPYSTSHAYYYFDITQQELRLVQREIKTIKAYVGRSEETLAVEVTPTEYNSILIGDRLINYTDDSEGIIIDKARFSDTTAIFTVEMAGGTDNKMEVGDEFRVLSNTAHRHSLVLSPPPRTTDAEGVESIYIFYAREHIPFSMLNIEHGTDEIELGTEWNTVLRHRVAYYASLEEKGIDNPQTQSFDIRYETDYMKAFPKANRRIREAISAWRGNSRKLSPKVTITQTGDNTVPTLTVR